MNRKLLILILLALCMSAGAEAQSLKQLYDALPVEFKQLAEQVVRVAEEVEDTTVNDSVIVDTPIGKVTMLKQKKLSKWDIPGGNYSGIVWLGGYSYAVVSDHEKKDGYYPFLISLDEYSGQVTGVRRLNMIGNTPPLADANGYSNRDIEGIAYFKPANTFFMSGEGDQRIIEYDAYGRPTGRELNVPEEFGLDKIFPNCGFEALTYSEETHKFWTTTEQSLVADGYKVSYVFRDRPCYLRLQSFGDDLEPAEQYAYRTDLCEAKHHSDLYAFGVPEIVAMSDGSLLVMEREFYVADKYMGSFVTQKIYRVWPSKSSPVTFSDNLSELPEERFLEKELIVDFKTQLSLDKLNIANYEGMTLGPMLKDGRHTLILISDSQDNFGNNIYKLKDYIKVIVF